MNKKDLPENWKKSAQSIRAIQVAFEFGTGVSESIRREANKNGLSTSDQIRKIIQLDIKPPKRPRLTVSLTEDDYKKLAQRYQLDAGNKAAIREAMRQELIDFGKSLQSE
jgi:alpha/beta superfamily hydrolase